MRRDYSSSLSRWASPHTSRPSPHPIPQPCRRQPPARSPIHTQSTPAASRSGVGDMFWRNKTSLLIAALSGIAVAFFWPAIWPFLNSAHDMANSWLTHSWTGSGDPTAFLHRTSDRGRPAPEEDRSEFPGRGPRWDGGFTRWQHCQGSQFSRNPRCGPWQITRDGQRHDRHFQADGGDYGRD